MKNIKRIASLLLAVVLLFSICACSSETNKGSTKKDSSSKTSDKDTEKTTKSDFEEVELETDYGKITIKGAEHFVDWDDKDAIRVYYDYVNTSKQSNAPGSCFYAEATQDGYEQDTTFASYGDDVEEKDNEYRYVRPGSQIRAVEELSMKLDGGKITIVFKSYYGDDEVSLEFNPKKLPGAPTDTLDLISVTSPEWTKGLPDKGKIKDYEVFIDKCEVVDGKDGTKVARVYYEFTNNSKEDDCFEYTVDSYIKVYQDGIQLLDGEPNVKVDEDDNNDVDVKPGKSIKLAKCYIVSSDNPIEVEGMDYNDNHIGATFE